MMIKTADGPGMVSPIDFHERTSPRFSKATWIATGIVVAAHVGLGTAMYYQRFEMPQIKALAQPDPIEVTFERLPMPVPQPKPLPAPPNTRVNETTATTPDVEPVAVTQGETVADSTTITTTKVSPDPVPDARPVEPVRPQPPAVIRNPSWSRQPSGDQMMRAYPQRAIAAGVVGSASLNCLVLPSGAVTDCNVTSETPGGYGFGRAAEGLSRYFRINPRTVNGAAEGSRVNINLRFNLPED
ncbi:TonB family protein [Phenylobacterium sp.]|uniref:TonB family protein n=1 Tax=Phenylobacterium sp. TaxID=1871053 RepID=UPI0027301E43|nr:TonB family protein [Phenylobacterium sp.]MDP1618861.1 TonB family protein [Phenylobacterium sp.]